MNEAAQLWNSMHPWRRHCFCAMLEYGYVMSGLHVTADFVSYVDKVYDEDDTYAGWWGILTERGLSLAEWLE